MPCPVPRCAGSLRGLASALGCCYCYQALSQVAAVYHWASQCARQALQLSPLECSVQAWEPLAKASWLFLLLDSEPGDWCWPLKQPSGVPAELQPGTQVDCHWSEQTPALELFLAQGFAEPP
jgi:hypothetical protein